ncbi:MAG: hypothetical protein M1835_002148 [Candelina submexicana]|nr:MAG: hypothetical protein M1835_002148 [Candelina submexicana]
MRIAVVTSKYWGPTPRQLTVSFMESTPADLRARIVSHMNAWTRTACISFAETQGIGDVRISRGPGGYYSYLGTDILHIPRNRQTMNLQDFTMDTPESEYKRVIRHETGHTLGCPHEHMRKELVMRIDPEKAYEYFGRTQRWDRQIVDQQVLPPLDEQSLMGTPADQTSIMCYQLPGSITRDGQPILGGLDIDQTDYAFVGQIYPKPGLDLVTDHEEHEEEWGESEDVEVAHGQGFPPSLTLKVGDMLVFWATGGHIQSGVDILEFFGPFLPGVVGDNGQILSPMGAPNTILFLARSPGRAIIKLVTGDPWHAPQTNTLDIAVES